MGLNVWSYSRYFETLLDPESASILFALGVIKSNPFYLILSFSNKDEPMSLQVKNAILSLVCYLQINSGLRYSLTRFDVVPSVHFLTVQRVQHSDRRESKIRILSQMCGKLVVRFKFAE
jgi:hypothetical protein